MKNFPQLMEISKLCNEKMRFFFKSNSTVTNFACAENENSHLIACHDVFDKFTRKKMISEEEQKRKLFNL